MDRSKDAGAAGQKLVDDMMLMSRMPLILFCDWWTTALQSFHHDCRPRRPACSAEDEGQLVVPEPIECEGEHVFA